MSTLFWLLVVLVFLTIIRFELQTIVDQENIIKQMREDENDMYHN